MNVDSIFAAAVEFKSPSERADFLEDACQGNASVRERVDALIRSHEEAGTFINEPAAPAAPTESTPISESAGSMIGPYKLLQQIGEGGFGVVFMAEQERPVRRKVALKIIKPGMDTKEVVARFEAERQALALMDHPNVAKVLDAGATESARPYFVMELVKGVPITDYCDKNNLATIDRLKLFITVCNAIHHAHQKGVIHRDIKPSNVMVTLHDGNPVVKVIDFGVSKAISQKLTEKTLFTAYGQLVGTPQYMSPEQAEMSGLDVDTRSDVYSLGVLLYELLTGSTPLESKRLREAGYAELQRIIREEESPRPSVLLSTLGDELTVIAQHRSVDAKRLQQQIRGDLDWIVMRALDKDRGRRYESASSFAADVDRLLRDEAVEARPPSTMYRLRKAARRHRGPFLAATALTATLLLGTIGTSVGFVRASNEAQTARREHAKAQLAVEREHDAAERERATADRATQVARQEREQRLRAQAAESQLRRWAYGADMQLVFRFFEDGNIGRASQLLQRHLPAAGETDLRGFEWYQAWRTNYGDSTVLPHWGDVGSVSFSPNGRFLATGSGHAYVGEIRLWDVESGSLLTSLKVGGRTDCLAFSPDGKTLASSTVTNVTLWDVDQRKPRLKFPTRGLARFVFSPDGRTLAVAAFAGRTVALYDSHTGKKLVSREWGELFDQAPGHLTFSPDGRKLAAIAYPRGTLVFLDARDLQNPTEAHYSVSSFAYSNDGSRIVVGTLGGDVRILSADGQVVEKQLPRQALDPIQRITFADQDGQVISYCLDGTVQTCDINTGKRLRRVQTAAPRTSVNLQTLAMSPRGTRIAWAAVDHTVRVKELSGEHIHEEIRLPETHVLDGHLWDRDIVFAPDGKNLILVSSGEVQLFDVMTNKMVLSRTFGEDEGKGTRDAVGCVATDDQRVIAASMPRDGGNLRIWNVLSGDILKEFSGDATEPYCIRIAPDARLVCVAGWDGSIRSCDIESGRQWVQKAHVGNIFCMGFSPDGNIVATGGEDGAVRLWDRESGSLKGTLDGHGAWVTEIVFSPTDNDQLASRDAAGTVHLWNLQTGQIQHTIEATGWVALAYSPDGRRLAVGNQGWITLHDVDTGSELARIDGVPARRLAFSSDGRMLAATYFDQMKIMRSASPGEVAADLEEQKIRQQQRDQDLEAIRPVEDALLALRSALRSNNTLDEQKAGFEAGLQKLKQFPEYYPSLAPTHLNALAWNLVTSPERETDDIDLAVSLAREAVELRPDHRSYRNTLGVALYRQGQWQEAIDTLVQQPNDRRRPAGRVGDGLIVAMSHWQLGHKEDARKSYETAIEVMNSEDLMDNHNLQQFRAEAESLLER